ncbi:helix-turn-helix domain-containing protein [Yinghuangia sp. ASG 101]|uniref:helix-turn-helix domain-containing protein n=1 Tax=Yinghuangia sp. ASG 101 TaxID=2896848 RepID=UPI001E2CC892|nr:helix-turn-helix domain-containing protein [Yinghuangia sp. ASG 101]UGQ09925.1 helix-turn-helix domain-containing protein [Yinghuangia sp. ASG 101]
MSIGQTLADARISAGLSVDRVSEVTRIRQTLVEAIEHDDFTGCGGDFYARGHIRSIARVVGVDADPLIAEYDETKGGTPAPSPSVIFEPERVKPERKLAPNWTAAMAAAVVVVLAFVIFQWVGGGDDNDSGNAATTTSAPPPPPNPEPAVSPPPPAAPPTQQVVAQAPDQVTVRADAVDGKSWISVTDGDGKKVFEGTVEKGAHKEWSNPEELRLVIGNAQAIHLNVNGKDIGPASTKSSVARVTFTPGNPELG